MQDRGRPEVALVDRSADFEIGGGAPSHVGQHNWFVNFSESIRENCRHSKLGFHRFSMREIGWPTSRKIAPLPLDLDHPCHNRVAIPPQQGLRAL